MHLCFTPITQDGRLSAKDILGNRASLVKWQDDFWKYMVKGYPELERGESVSMTGRRHIPTRVFKQAIDLTKQAERIQETLTNINPLNARKKRDELIPMIQRFIPKMEDYLGTIRRYKAEFERQERANASLRKEVEDSKIGIRERLDAYQLRLNYDRLKEIYNAIPEDIRRDAVASLRHQQAQHQPKKREWGER